MYMKDVRHDEAVLATAGMIEFMWNLYPEWVGFLYGGGNWRGGQCVGTHSSAASESLRILVTETVSGQKIN
ncbi:hypothetical protein PF001_g4329 [Phytophthora fragariae]|uniref:Uncharacterized protein n=1 Tax=Phytophthora fragariae TaxID=53985 RepID=A0A6A4EHR0_9STRA|nr:hypothetical protein PF001_g4329 [Phytophthora fragariae]